MTLGVPFQAVFSSLVEVFEVAEKDRSKLLARLRNMQRDGFPPGINVGRGVKVAYGIEPLTAILFYHMAVDAGFPPDFAIRAFNAHQDLLLMTAADKSAFEGPWPGPSSSLVVVTGEVLSPHEPVASSPHAFAGKLEVRPLIEIHAEFDQFIARPGGIHVFDLAGTLSKALRYLVESGAASLSDVTDALAGIRSGSIGKA